jgi:asparagine synthase (glutamine-hydrolysing)
MIQIAGIIGRTPAPCVSAEILRMVETMSRHSAASSGHHRFEQLSLQVGWSASVRDSSAITQLTWNDDRTVCLVFSGENASSTETRAAALAALLRSYERSGVAALSELNGWFSGVIVDLRKQSVTVFNDRYGLGRVYYTETARGVIFASEAKAVLSVVPATRNLDPRGLAEFYSIGCVLQNRSLFSGIALLPPASAWTFHRDGRVERQRYFDPTSWEQQAKLGAVEYSERLSATFARVVSRTTNGGSPVALSLTGGLDSRAVIAWAKADPGDLPCYTFGGPVRDCADVHIARRLAKLCRHPHTTIRIGDEFFSDFARLAEKSVYVSDGAMDVSGAVELHVNQKARAIAPVRLTGNYGSEILRSHVAFRPAALDRSLFTPEFGRLLDEAAETYRQEAACHRLSFIAFKQVPWHHYARFAIERSQLTPRSPFLDNELVALAYRAPSELTASPRPLLELIARGNPALATIGTDRALRAKSVPLFSKLASGWQDFTAKAEYAYDYGMPRWLARADHALSRLHLEQLFLGRHKFYHFRLWYRDRLSGFVHANGSAAQAQPFCYRDGAAKQLASEHTSGRANRTLDLHRLLTVQLTERSLLHSA